MPKISHLECSRWAMHTFLRGGSPRQSCPQCGGSALRFAMISLPLARARPARQENCPGRSGRPVERPFGAIAAFCRMWSLSPWVEGWTADAAQPPLSWCLCKGMKGANTHRKLQGARAFAPLAVSHGSPLRPLKKLAVPSAGNARRRGLAAFLFCRRRWNSKPNIFMPKDVPFRKLRRSHDVRRKSYF